MKKRFSAVNYNNPKQTTLKKPFLWLCLMFLGWLFFKSDDKIGKRFLKFDKEEFDKEEPDAASESFSDNSSAEELSQIEENKTIEKKDLFHFIINKSTNKYHTKECNAVKKLSGEKRLDTDIEAVSVQDAKKQLEKMGYVPCGLCDR